MRVLDPREWTSGVLASSGRVTEEEGGADATQLLLLPYRMQGGGRSEVGDGEEATMER